MNTSKWYCVDEDGFLLSAILITDAEAAMRRDVSKTEPPRKPPRPSEFHTFNRATKKWEDQRTLQTLRADAWAKVKAKRDAIEFGPFSWGDHTFDGNVDSQRRISLAALEAYAAIQSGRPWSKNWTLADDSVLQLSATEMLAVAEAMGANINAAHEWARGRRALIDAATTREDVSSVIL